MLVGGIAPPAAAAFSLGIRQFTETASRTNWADYILNGSFESGVEYEIQDGIFGIDPDQWQSGLNVQEDQARDNLTDPDGSYSLVIGRIVDDSGNLGGLINTGHNVAAGQTFDLSFQWRSAFQWDSDDVLNWRLLTTSDDTVGGTVTEIASGTEIGTTSGYVSVDLAGLGTVTSASYGRDLWLEFYSSTATVEGTGAEFARVDEVNLSYVPEPATISLLALGGLAAVIRRRK